MDYINLIADAPKTCLYALVNESNRRIYLTHCRDFITSLNRIVSRLVMGDTELKLLLEDYRNNLLRVEILNIETDKIRQLQLLNFYQDYYRNNGYSMYKDIVYLSYSVCIEIRRDVLAYVLLKSKNQTKTIVGVFNSISEANAFVNEYYSSKIYFPIYALNQLTKEYIETGKASIRDYARGK